MNYQIKASSLSNEVAIIPIKESNIDFGTICNIIKLACSISGTIKTI